MSGDLSLFGDDEPNEQPNKPVTAPPVATWQIELLRRALDAHGLATMAERQSFIEATVGRQVESLRTLTHDEALNVVSRLGQASKPMTATGSAWDQRDEDTWIDRL